MKKILTCPLLILILLLTACQWTQASQPTSTHHFDPPTDISFLAQPEQTIRLMSFNVGWDSIFPDGDPLNDPYRTQDKSDAFIRILKAVRPQILCLQEINPRRDPRQIAEILDGNLPLGGGQGWQVHSGGDNFIAASFDLHLTDNAIVQGNSITGRGHAMVLVDLPDEQTPLDFYLVCAHFKSQGGQSNINARQTHADAVVSWVRDIQTPGGEIDLPRGTPFSIVGDLNVYDTDPAHHLYTLLTGDIADESKYGSDISPDWDRSYLADALLRHNLNGNEIYTWRDDTQEFNPGVLDHILYTDSVIRIEKGFVLNTMTLSPEVLDAAGLQATDVMLEAEVGNYDHLPLVVDLSFHSLTVAP